MSITRFINLLFPLYDSILIYFFFFSILRIDQIFKEICFIKFIFFHICNYQLLDAIFAKFSWLLFSLLNRIVFFHLYRYITFLLLQIISQFLHTFSFKNLRLSILFLLCFFSYKLIFNLFECLRFSNLSFDASKFIYLISSLFLKLIFFNGTYFL